MLSRNLVGTVLGGILVWAASFAAALGQNDPAVGGLLASSGEDLPLSSSPMPADTAQDAGGRDLGCCCQPSGGPRWTASADFIFLDRLGGANQTLVEIVPNTPTRDRIPGSNSFAALYTAPGTDALNGNGFQQGFAGGPRLDLIGHGDQGYDLELSYFQIDGWSSEKTVVPGSATDCLVMTAPGRWLNPAQTPGGFNGWLQTNQTDTQGMAWAYASKLYNAELNVRWNPSPLVTMLAGFRWVSLRENLSGALDPPTMPEPPFWNTATTNNLYGFQIGAEGKLLERGRFSIIVPVKAGVYDNNAQQATTVSVIFKQLAAGSASTNHAAFVGQTGLQCKYQLTNDLLLRAGYEAIWLEGVALAPGQVQETYTTTNNLNNSVQALGVNCNSGAFYHGTTVGLEYSF
jgi:hypothetical protein